MALEFEPQKPQPLMLGDKAYYTLSSYDPVSIEVRVPYVCEEDIDMALSAVLMQTGASPEQLSDPAWLSEHFDGISNLNTLRDVIRSEITEMNARFAEQQKVGLAVGELTKRLEQSVPAMHVARYRQDVQMSFEQQIASEGMTVDQFLMRAGTTRSKLEAMFDQQAKQAAEGDAALDAYAREKKLTVSEDEFGQLLGIPASEIDNVIAQVKAAGQLGAMKEAALHAKAAQTLAAECSCTYLHETEAEARVRVAQAQRLREQYDRGSEADGNAGSFTLV
jgi:hypothetical protein